MDQSRDTSNQRFDQIITEFAATMLSVKMGIPVVLKEEFELDGIKYTYNRTITPEQHRFNMARKGGGGGSLILEFKDDTCSCVEYENWNCTGQSPMVSRSGEASDEWLKFFGVEHDPTIQF